MPSQIQAPIAVELLSEPYISEFMKLENDFLSEIEEPPLTKERQARLTRAIKEERITFFVARKGSKLVGMCSVARCFSTFSCSETGVFDDFYIASAFRKTGLARKLADAAKDWGRENGLASVTVTCSLCDEKMYQSLGFDTHIGKTFAFLPQIKLKPR